MNRAALSRTPWPVLLVFFLVILPPIITYQAERRYRVLPQDLSVAFTIVEAIIVAVYVTQAVRGRKEFTRIAIAAFCISGILVNLGGLGFLINKMLNPSGLDGQRLLISALYLWVSNLLFFALAYWACDGGGPSERDRNAHPRDLIFPEMQTGQADFHPKFSDYVYVAFSTSTAFSATDTLTASSRIRALLMLQAAISLATVAIVAARAVNIFPSGS
jgi:uncharacterized membrane protein